VGSQKFVAEGLAQAKQAEKKLLADLAPDWEMEAYSLELAKSFFKEARHVYVDESYDFYWKGTLNDVEYFLYIF
jgi:hypothetical protein